MANKSIQLKDGSDNLYPSIYRTYVNGGYSTTSVPHNTTTRLPKTITVGSGTWMIVAYVQWQISANQPYNVVVMFNNATQRTVRANMLNGGGITNTVIFTTNGSGTVAVDVWQYSGQTCSCQYWIDAIKLS